MTETGHLDIPGVGAREGRERILVALDLLREELDLPQVHPLLLVQALRGASERTARSRCYASWRDHRLSRDRNQRLLLAACGRNAAQRHFGSPGYRRLGGPTTADPELVTCPLCITWMIDRGDLRL